MSLKHRLVGASVVIASMVIFLPVLIDSERRESRPISTEIELPSPPNYDFEEQTLPKPGQFDFRPSESESPPAESVTPVTPVAPVDFKQPVELPPGAFDDFSRLTRRWKLRLKRLKNLHHSPRPLQNLRHALLQNRPQLLLRDPLLRPLLYPPKRLLLWGPYGLCKSAVFRVVTMLLNSVIA